MRDTNNLGIIHFTPVQCFESKTQIIFMNQNQAFIRAFNSLGHPISMTAIVLLLFNDHWLRWHYPSRITGKLGDFSWLIFAPFIAAIIFAWIIPHKFKYQERVVGPAAFIFIGLWFALAKTVPIVHQLTTDTWESIIGWQGTQRMDASDLLTLPGLLIGWWVWRHTPNTAINLRPLAYIAFGLGIVGTLASDVPSYKAEDYGISTICQNGTHLIARVDGKLSNTSNRLQEYEFQNPPNDIQKHPALAFISHDGGLSWTTDNPLRDFTQLNCSTAGQTEIQIPNSTFRYRWEPDLRIERSLDDGQSWISGYDLAAIQQTVRHDYHQQKRDGWSVFEYDPVFLPSPISALADSNSGNVLFAMGWNGILLRTRAGEWKWITLGNYGLDNIQQLSNIFSLLHLEIIYTLILILLVITTFLTNMLNLGWDFEGTLIFSSWMAWVFPSIILLTRADFLSLLLITFMCFVIPMIVVISIVWIRKMWRMRKFMFIPVATGVAASALYLLPLILWSQGLIPNYRTAAIFSTLLVPATYFTGYNWFLHRYPEIKHKRKEWGVSNELHP